MLYVIFFLICFGASIIGAICGIGGGVIIKPVLDAFGILDISAISFLSGCTVLSMTAYSVIKSKINGENAAEGNIGITLGVGAALGGMIGKWLFSWIKSMNANPNRVGMIQAICLLLLTIMTLIYTLQKDKIKTIRIHNAIFCIVIGIFLGVLSSFLGIGGGPINLVVLFYFFSMGTKSAVNNSLYIIFFSQIASLIASIVTRSIPEFPPVLLIWMVAGGIAGGIFGREVNKKLEEKMVERMFMGLMIVLILINIYNIYKYM